MPDVRLMLLEYETDEVGRLARESPTVKRDLIAAFGDVSETVRERALLSAIEVADPSLVNNVVKALSDAEDNVRIAAAQVLAWYRQPRTIPSLFAGLKDKNVWVRSHCAAGLSKLLNGPIWARIPADDIDKLVNGLPGMTDEEVRLFLDKLRVSHGAIDKYIMWRNKGFDIEIDTSVIEEYTKAEPVILADAEHLIRSTEHIESRTVADSHSEEVERILSEIPESILSKIPE